MSDRNPLTVNELRPDDLTQEFKHLFAADLEALLAKWQAFNTVGCPACESTDAKPVFVKNGFHFVACGCETIYVNPRPSLDMLMAYYNNARSVQFWNERVYPASEATRRARIFAPRAARVKELSQRHAAPSTFLVDVGSGFGTFCEEAGKLDFFSRVVAVEPSRDQAEMGRKKGLEFVAQPIETAQLDGVGVITAFELIEHLFSPRTFLQACHRALLDEGLLILTTPNVKGFDFVVLGEHCDNFQGPNHLNYFHPQSLGSLLEENGFLVLETFTPGHLDTEIVRNKVLAGEFDLAGQPFLQQVLLHNWDQLGRTFQRFLADNQLSSHLWMVAKKKAL